jgi:hypothetical protein
MIVPLTYQESMKEATRSNIKAVSSTMEIVQAYATTRTILNAMIALSILILLRFHSKKELPFLFIYYYEQRTI